MPTSAMNSASRRWQRAPIMMVLLIALLLSIGASAQIRVKGTRQEGTKPFLEGSFRSLEELNAAASHTLSFTRPNNDSSLFTSTCSPVTGCPRNSMVWASGPLTYAELLTPASFAVEANLTLQLSLCCKYYYRTSMLVDGDLYDRFLSVLLQATPFQVLSSAEKRGMFPQAKAFIRSSSTGKVFTASSVLADAPRDGHGQGDVLVLVSGAFERPQLAQEQVEAAMLLYDEEEVSQPRSESTPSIPKKRFSRDVQLKVVNEVLKCKCPHTLLVMPILRLHSDALPPVSIVGLGSHCANTSASTNASLTRSPPMIARVEMPSQPGTMGYALSFYVTPAVPPATVVTWRVRQEGSSSLVLDHQFVVGAVVDPSDRRRLLPNHAHSPFFLVTPHQPYTVEVQLSRGYSGSPQHQRTEGRFVLRVPFDRHWELPPVAMAPHFGFERNLRLSAATMAHAEDLRAALRPTSSGSGHYRSFWSNTPRDDQLLPQHPIRIPHNPFSTTESQPAFPLFVGRNDVTLWVADVDEVCEAVRIEDREWWAVQAIVLSRSPATACEESVPVEALQLHGLLHQMRTERPFLVNVPHTSWEASPEELGIEGSFNCSGRVGRPSALRGEAAPAGKCRVAPALAAYAAGTHASLRMDRRGVYDVHWVTRVAVRPSVAATILADENLDKQVATRVVGSTAGGDVLIDVRSRLHIVVRRVSHLPRHVHVELPMHALRWKVQPPTTADRSVSADHPGPSGRWSARWPLVEHSVDERGQLEVNVEEVPNVRRVLPNRTLQFIAEDPGEDLEAVYGLNYRSRCPDMTVEYLITVVPFPAPAITPAYVPIYTEEHCILLDPPRAPRKDELVSWKLPPNCGRFVERYQHVEGDEGIPRVVSTPREGREWVAPGQSTRNIGATLTLMACGMQAYHRCDVRWEAQNLVGTVSMTYSLRRCLRPPSLLYHADQLQQTRSYPSSIFQLPRLLLAHDPMALPVGDGANITTTTHTRHSIPVLPIAGEAATYGYSFNHTGLQEDFEAHIGLVAGAAANQLFITRRHHPYQGEGPSLVVAGPIQWRSRARRDVVYAADTDRWDDEAITPASWWQHITGFPSNSAPHDVDRDARINAEVHLRHAMDRRRVDVAPVFTSAAYPLNITIRTSTTAALAAQANRVEVAEDVAVFAARGMCAPRREAAMLLTLQPLGTVRVDERFGVSLPGPTAPAVAVLPVCRNRYVYSRHPDLHSIYGYDLTWSCTQAREQPFFEVDKFSPTHSLLSAVEPKGWSGRGGAKQAWDGWSNLCSLTVRNAITGTQQVTAVELRRVWPTPLPNLNFVVLSENALGAGNRSISQVGAKALRPRRVVGKSVVLHIDSATPAIAAAAPMWVVESAVPAKAAGMGHKVLMDAVQFTALPNHPAALARGRGGTTVLVSGFARPGLYTIALHTADPIFPEACPNASLVETFEVFHAEVVEKELVICGDAATLRAIPLPRELTREFVGQWEVVSLQTSDTEVWTAGTNFTGITFDSGNRASTLVHGLPFGILTMRWAIYRHSDDGGRLVERILVDYDVVRVLVLTENLASHRVVTLSESLELTTTSSTRDWFVEEDPTHSTKLQLTTLRHSGLTSYNYSRAYSTDPAFSHVHLGPQTQLRPGAGLLTLRNLPEGPIYLGYQLIPSSNLFGEMQGRTCSLAMRLEVERVSAYFTTNINMDHECDAYTGKGRIQLCLHAELSPQHKNRRARYVEATGNDGQPWSSHVQLVDANRLEGIIKGGAASLEKQHCGVPWWLWSTSSWRNVTLVEKAGLPSGRCMSFFVTAGRHLSPREAAQPFFASTGSGESCGGDVVSSSVIEGAVVTSSSGGSNAFSTHGVPKRFLPVMQTGRLERLHHALRPLLGLQGLPEEATTELNVSRGNESIVTFRLDVAERLAGFPMYGSDASHSADLGNATSALLHGSPSWSILRQCANGTVRAADVLPYWMEINRPDGALDVTSPEWLEYVEQVRHTLVPCEVLFRSLQTLVNPAAGDRKRHEHQPDADERLVSLTALEHQLDSIQQTSKYTKDGIEVTGLRPDLQEALSRRTITRSQLAAIEEARRHRREAEEQAHRRRQLELANAESLRTPAERLRIALQRYAQATHEEVATIRIRLPSYDPFAVPYDTYLRTALHKDAVCGTELGPREETTRTNPYALIPLGKVKIVDAPPTLSIEPKIIKQCEVEGEIPLITVSLSGSVWAKEAFHNAQVRLEEVQNPNISRNEPDTVGLRPCLGQLHEGLSTTVSGSTRKHLYLQLGACPGFQLLSPMEYNEQEDSAMLLEKLRYPRLLRVTVLQALKPDSFTSRSSHMPSGTDLSFIVEVRPTLARLHLRTGAMHRDEVGQASDANTRWLLPGATTEAAHPLRRYFRDRQPPVPFLPTESRPLVLCERDLRQHGFDLGVELIGDQWMDPVGEAQLHTHEDQARLLQRYADLVAEHAQFEDEEDAEYLLASGANNEDPNAPSHRHRRRRTPENIALLNSFSVVAHYSYDSTHHLYLKGGGVYRSHFVHYLFSSILADPQVLNEHAFVFRYNTSFMAVTVPPQPASHTDDGGDDPFLTMAANGEQEWGWPIAQEEPSATDATARGRRSTPATTSGVDVRRFSKIEEILFAIPGIATHCRGCLLADTTLYVAGDLTGVWSWKQPSMWSSSSTSHTLDHSSLRGPLLIPWHAADTIPRQWAFSWVCPHAAQRALEQLEKYQTYYASYRRRRSGEASEPLPPVYLEMNVVMYAMRDALGTPLPPSARPTVVLRSEPMWLTNDQGAMAPGGSSFTALHAESSSTFVDGLVFQINASSASAGFTTLAADVLAHRRLGSPLISSTFDYRFGGAVAEGRLTANASVFVQVCVPVEVVEGPSRKLGNSRCTVVSITDALMVLEPPVRAPTLSFLHRWLRGSSDAMVAHDEVAATPTTSPIIHFIMDALHHAFLSTLLYWLLATGHLRLGGQLPTPSTDSWMAEEERRHLSFSIMCFMALCFIYHYIPVVWVLAWLALWMQVLYASTRPQVLLYFVLSMLYWWYVM